MMKSGLLVQLLRVIPVLFALSNPPPYGVIILKNDQTIPCGMIDNPGDRSYVICRVAEGEMRFPHKRIKRIQTHHDLALLEYARLQILQTFKVKPARVHRLHRRPAEHFKSFEYARFIGQNDIFTIELREDLANDEALEAIRHELGHVLTYNQNIPELYSEAIAVLFAGNARELIELAPENATCADPHQSVELYYSCAAALAIKIQACLTDHDFYQCTGVKPR